MVGRSVLIQVCVYVCVHVYRYILLLKLIQIPKTDANSNFISPTFFLTGLIFSHCFAPTKKIHCNTLQHTAIHRNILHTLLHAD